MINHHLKHLIDSDLKKHIEPEPEPKEHMSNLFGMSASEVKTMDPDWNIRKGVVELIFEQAESILVDMDIVPESMSPMRPRFLDDDELEMAEFFKCKFSGARVTLTVKCYLSRVWFEVHFEDQIDGPFTQRHSFRAYALDKELSETCIATTRQEIEAIQLFLRYKAKNIT